MRKRPCQINFRLNKSEQCHLKEEIEKSGLTQETYLRKLIMGKEIKPCAPHEYHDLLREVRAIGNNINQTAKIANSEKTISSKVIVELLQMQRLLLALVKGLS